MHETRNKSMQSGKLLAALVISQQQTLKNLSWASEYGQQTLDSGWYNYIPSNKTGKIAMSEENKITGGTRYESFTCDLLVAEIYISPKVDLTLLTKCL